MFRIGTCLDKLTGSVRNLTAENKELRLRSTIQPINASAIERGVHPKNQVQKDSDILLLEQQADLLAEEVQKSQEFISSRDECISQLTDELRTKLDSLESLNNENNELLSKNIILEEKICDGIEQSAHYKTLSSDLKGRVLDLEKVQSINKIEIDKMKDSMDELEDRNDELHREILQMATSLQEIQQNLVSAAADYDRLNSEYEKYSKELASAKTELRTAKRTLSCLSLSGQQCDGNIHNWEDQIRSLQLQCHSAHAKAAALESQVKVMHDRETRLSQILGVESTIQMINEQHTKDIEKKDNTLRDYKIQSVELHLCIESMERKLNSMVSEKATIENALQAERESQALVDLKQALSAANVSLHKKELEVKSALSQSAKLEAERNDLKGSLLRLNKEQSALIREGVANQQEIKDRFATHQNENLVLKQNIQSEIAQRKEDARKVSETARQTVLEHQAQISVLELHIGEKGVSLQQALYSLDQAQEEMTRMTNQYKEEVNKTKQALGRIAADFQKSQGGSETKSLIAQYSSLLEDNMEYKSLLNEKEKAIKLMDLALVRTEANVCSLGKQLSLVVREQTSRIQRERELKLEVHTLKLRRHNSGTA